MLELNEKLMCDECGKSMDAPKDFDWSLFEEVICIGCRESL